MSLRSAVDWKGPWPLLLAWLAVLVDIYNQETGFWCGLIAVAAVCFVFFNLFLLLTLEFGMRLVWEHEEDY